MNIYNLDNMIEILYDVKEDSDKEVGWKQHKQTTQRLAASYKRLKNPKYKRILECGNFLEFRRYSDNSLRLNSANFCQTRLCPTCLWRRSRKIFAQLSIIMDSIVKSSDEYGYTFLTLTCKNVTASDLINCIDKMYSAFKTLTLRKRFKSAVHGWFRCFEITFNWEKNSYHPHFHVVLAVDKSYFTSGLYIQQKEWCALWRSCLRVDYNAVVDIRRFKDSENGGSNRVAEISKYTVKPSNVLADTSGLAQYNSEIKETAKKQLDKITDEIVKTLDEALTNRRLIGFGGIFREKHRELNLEDTENGSLIYAGDGEIRKDLSYIIERYRWSVGLKNYTKIDNAQGLEHPKDEP